MIEVVTPGLDVYHLPEGFQDSCVDILSGVPTSINDSTLFVSLCYLSHRVKIATQAGVEFRAGDVWMLLHIALLIASRWVEDWDTALRPSEWAKKNQNPFETSDPV